MLWVGLWVENFPENDLERFFERAATSRIEEQNLSNAQLILHRDAAHGFYFLYPALFVERANMFLRDQTK
jgi:hypothetical protein